MQRTWRKSYEDFLTRKCREARTAERWLDLERIGEQWTKWDGQNADAWLFRADAAQHLGNFAKAAECLDLIPDSNPKALPALVSLATLQFGSLDRPLDGVQTCERILRMEPRTTAAHQQLIMFYSLTFQRRKLEQQIRFAIDHSREPPQAYVYLFLADTMRMADGVESNERWLRQYPDSELFQVARLMHMPEPESGVKNAAGTDKYSLADDMLKKYPVNLELLAYQVDLAIRKGRVEDLIGLLRRLPIEADEDSRFWRAKGWLHLNRDEIPKAKEALLRAIKLYPQDWNARNWLADTLRREGKFAEAEKLNEIVLLSRKLRDRVTKNGADPNIPAEVLEELSEFAERCGDTQVSSALKRRLGLSHRDLN